MLSLRIECDNAPLASGAQTSLQRIAASGVPNTPIVSNTVINVTATGDLTPMNAINTTATNTTGTGSSSGSTPPPDSGVLRYISPELIPSPPQASYLLQRSCPTGISGLSTRASQTDVAQLGTAVVPVARMDLPDAAPAGSTAALYDVLLDWGQAALFCRNQGGSLITFTSNVQVC